MILNITQLKNKWNAEKNSYKKQEVGSGAQKFVKDVLKCQDLFNFTEGKLSTDINKRNKEFVEESRTKAGRKADVVIYVNSEIIVPIEVEKYGCISQGFEQLLQYQLDLDKKYGILTDGYLWQFYNNAYLLREFNLEQIFDSPELLNEFWLEYIKPDFYYLSYFEEQGQLKLVADNFAVEKRRGDFFRDITALIRSLKNKLKLEGYFNGLDAKDKERKAVEITYAYIIQFILYKTLVDNKFAQFSKEFSDITESLHNCLKTQQYGKILGITDGISKKISQNIYHPFAKEQEFIAQKLLTLIHQPANVLHDVSPWLDIFVFIKKYNFANVKNEIFGYIYENYLKTLYEDTKKGQYFTDPAVVNFMLDQIDYTTRHLKHTLYFDRDVSIIDPSCGCGTFLYSAVDRLIETTGYENEKVSKIAEQLISENVFGLDIEEFPLYLAEMNILMRMLPLILHKEYASPVTEKIKVFKTNDSLAEFLDTAIKNTLNDLDVEYQKNNGQMLLFTQKLNLGYASYVRDESDLAEMKRSLENQQIPRRRFDYVIGNPPYISYNECSKSGLLIFKLIKEGKVKLNNIYGVNLHSIPNRRKKYSPKPNLYVFFIALGLALLKDNAKICYIVPQTLLTAGDLDVIRYHLAKFTTIEKIITFSGKMFIGRGLKQNKPVATSSLVFVARRKAPAKMHEVEVIHYKNPNDNIEKCLSNILNYNHKKIIYKKIFQNKLLLNVSNWNFIKQDKKFLDFYRAYKRNSEDIAIYYDHATAEHYFKSKFYFDIGFILKNRNVLKRNISENYNILDFRCFQNYSKFTPAEYYPKDKKLIKLAQNSQGLEVLEQKYKIVWSIKNLQKFYFTDIPIIFHMGKASIICSNDRKEILYLFSLLNFPATNLLLKTNLKNENEKEYLVPVKAIKEFVRVPKITEDNLFIKKEIIKRTQQMLALEERKLSDFVDFSNILVQKFDQISVGADLVSAQPVGAGLVPAQIVLVYNHTQKALKIKSNPQIVSQAIIGKYGEKKLISEIKQISLSELKSLPVIDLEKQRSLKDYVDNLVFALYFNVKLPQADFRNNSQIKNICAKNKFYKILAG